VTVVPELKYRRVQDIVFRQGRIDASSRENLVLRQTEFVRCKFYGCDFTKSQLLACKFYFCSFYDCRFNGVDIKHSLIFKSAFQDCSFIGVCIENTRIEECSFNLYSYDAVVHQHVSILETSIRSMSVDRCIFKYGSMQGVKISSAGISGTEFINTRFLNSIRHEQNYFEVGGFYGCRFAGSLEDRLVLSNVTFKRGCEFTAVELKYVDIKLLDLQSRDELNKGQLDACSFVDVKFNNSSITGSIENSSFCAVTYDGTDLRNMSFDSCEFQNTDFSNSDIGSLTTFNECSMSSTVSFERYQTGLMIGGGGFQKGYLAEAKILDDVAELKLKYSGPWAWLHAAALIAFLFPYGWFLFSKWSLASFAINAENGSITLLTALGRYIVNGGENWKVEYQCGWSAFAFLLILTYNCLRFIFLAKTKKLELEESVKGSLVKFTLRNDYVCLLGFKICRWLDLWKVANVLIYIYYAFAFTSLYHFMTQEIPL